MKNKLCQCRCDCHTEYGPPEKLPVEPPTQEEYKAILDKLVQEDPNFVEKLIKSLKSLVKK